MYENRAPREEFDVTCAECGKATTVPFKPSGTRPVLCRECFSKNRPAGGSGPRSFGDRPPRRDNFGGGGGAGGDRQMFDTTSPPRAATSSAATASAAPTPARPLA
jgi:CxxC-x17-CxxC domain-containing protein